MFSLAEAVTRTLHNFCARSAGGLASGTIQTRHDTSKVTSEKFSEVKDEARTKRRHSPRAPSIAGGRVRFQAVAREAATVKRSLNRSQIVKEQSFVVLVLRRFSTPDTGRRTQDQLTGGSRWV